MSGATHLISGLSIAIYLGYTKPAELVVVAIASLLPDIDRQNSLLGRWIPFLPSLIEGTLGKRTLTHCFAFLALLSAVLASCGLHFYIVPLLIGFLSHLVLDIVTGQIALLYPIPKKFTLNFGIPPVFVESLYLIGVGVYYAFHWRDMLTHFSFV